MTTDNHTHDDYASEPRLRDMPRRLENIPRMALLALIRLYQMTISRGLPPDTCRFYPSCSHYGYQAIYKYGAIKGSLMAAWRVRDVILSIQVVMIQSTNGIYTFSGGVCPRQHT
jgi:putative membrane protein insertion efficiency factor